jgi:hypothetical protein
MCHAEDDRLGHRIALSFFLDDTRRPLGSVLRLVDFFIFRSILLNCTLHFESGLLQFPRSRQGVEIRVPGSSHNTSCHLISDL